MTLKEKPMLNVRVPLSLALVLGAALWLPAFGEPPSRDADGPKPGLARMVAPVVASKDGEVRVPVTIDLSRAETDGRPAVLGAYVIAFSFDRAKVAFVRADRGTAPEFQEPPSATPAPRANELGIVKVVGDQGNVDAPIGAVSVAVLTFRELAPGGAATIKPRIESLASSLRRGEGGRYITDLKIPFEQP